MNQPRSHWKSRATKQDVSLLAGIAVVFLGAAAEGQSRNTEHTLKLDDPLLQPTASFDDIDWMVGSWEGEGLGGAFEEDWMPPSAGTMTGVFKLIHDGRPSMYEFMLIVEENDSLSIQLKHFNSDFESWEEKSEFVSFALVKLTEDAAYFDGLTYRRLKNDRLAVHVSVGEAKEEYEFMFVRSTPRQVTAGPSPFSGFESRGIKALSAQEIESYLAGEGMGLALAAELNGYPGPKHVLELKQELKLTPEQVETTQAVYDKMHSAAIALGGRLVEAEANLDRLFAQHEISGETLESATREIAGLAGELRAVHLQAHLEMVEILSAEQRRDYVTHRGYGGSAMPLGHHPDTSRAIDGGIAQSVSAARSTTSPGWATPIWSSA